jgi:hypothetical protein
MGSVPKIARSIIPPIEFQEGHPSPPNNIAALKPERIDEPPPAHTCPRPSLIRRYPS